MTTVQTPVAPTAAEHPEASHELSLHRRQSGVPLPRRPHHRRRGYAACGHPAGNRFH